MKFAIFTLLLIAIPISMLILFLVRKKEKYLVLLCSILFMIFGGILLIAKIYINIEDVILIMFISLFTGVGALLTSKNNE